MDFTPEPRRPRSESIVPMINVVFLLLIFFLMTSQIAPPEPFDVAPPTASKHQETDTEVTVYIDANGTIAFEDLRGDPALEAAALAAGDAKVFRIRADAEMEGTKLAAILKSLSTQGLKKIELVVVPK